MNSHQVQQPARLITAAMIALCMTQPGFTQRIYQVGVPVCDTIDTKIVSKTPGGCDLPEDYLEFVHAPYVTGLSFQLIITETSGRVRSDLSDSVKAGDVFKIPDMSAIPDTLRSGLRIHFGAHSSFGFITRIVGTPTVAYEGYYSILDAGMTTNVCRNIYLYSADRGQILHVQPSAAVRERDNGTISARFQLLQNYPNPFNPQTNIEYFLPKSSLVRLVIYDMLGQEVRILVDEFQQQGVQSVVWDGRKNYGQPAPSGQYFYRLTANGFTKSSKSLLLR